MSYHTTRNTGFTLIELLITLTVLAITLTIAVPSFRSLILNQRIKTASYDFFSALSFARSEAIKRNLTITIRAGETADGTWQAGWRVVDNSNNILRTWGPLANLSLEEMSGNATSLNYSANGRLASATAPKFQINSSSSVSDVTARCIQVDLSGRPITKTGNCP